MKKNSLLGNSDVGLQHLLGNDAADEASSPSVQSAETCLGMLTILMQSGGPQTLKALAATAGISASKAHRYLQTLVNTGFASQGKRSGRYDLGTMAMALGFSALERVDLVNRTSDHLEDLAVQTSCQVLLSVWGERGPVIVRIQNAGTGFEPANRLGSRLPVWASATGNIFLAFMSRQVTSQALALELEYHTNQPAPAIIADRIKKVRAAGYAVSAGGYMEGVSGIAAPIIDMQNDACAVVTLAKPMEFFQENVDPTIENLIRFCRDHSIFNAPLYRNIVRIAE